MARKTAPQASFDDQLVLFRYFLHELKIDSLGALSEKLNSAEYEGFNESEIGRASCRSRWSPYH